MKLYHTPWKTWILWAGLILLVRHKMKAFKIFFSKTVHFFSTKYYINVPWMNRWHIPSGKIFSLKKIWVLWSRFILPINFHTNFPWVNLYQIPQEILISWKTILFLGRQTLVIQASGATRALIGL